MIGGRGGESEGLNRDHVFKERTLLVNFTRFLSEKCTGIVPKLTSRGVTELYIEILNGKLFKIIVLNEV